MRIVCPSCAATYDVPDARLAPGQSVRCARCGTDWAPVAEPEPMFKPPVSKAPVPPLPLPDPEPASYPEPAPTDVPMLPSPNLYAPAPDRPNAITTGEPAVFAAWAVSIALLVGLGWAAVTWRGDVMRAWPPSERLYTAIGLPSGR